MIVEGEKPVAVVISEFRGKGWGIWLKKKNGTVGSILMTTSKDETLYYARKLADCLDIDVKEVK